ncbi:GbsR/MarR family transcriptional regulator [Haliangium ochraceum]|nr:helix-turn-helix domain-containing protein [Haliangium ochraceum]
MPSQQDAVILRVADAIGGLMEFWGFKRNMGRIWTLLYLAPEPFSAAEIAQRLSLSSGAVSMLLGELTHWGAVKKAWRPGSRRDHYESESNIWKLVSRVFRERELRKISETIEIFEEALQVLGSGDAGDAVAPAHLAAVQGRIEGLLTLARTGKKLLQAVLAGQAVDTSPLERFEPPSD